LIRWIYLALAVWGAIHPMYYFVQWFMAEGWSLSVAEVAVRRNFIALVAIPATFCIGVSCGLPLYLFLRAKPIT